VVAEDALELRGEGGERRPRALVRRLGLELDPREPEPLEAVLEHEQLRLDVDAAAPQRGDDPGPADLGAAMLGAEGREATASDDAAARPLDRGERNRGSLRLGGTRLLPPGVEVGAEVRVAELPDPRVGGGLAQGLLMLGRERLQHDQPALQLHRSSSR
jgi:hypothetical protein